MSPTEEHLAAIRANDAAREAFDVAHTVWIKRLAAEIETVEYEGNGRPRRRHPEAIRADDPAMIAALERLAARGEFPPEDARHAGNPFGSMAPRHATRRQISASLPRLPTQSQS